VSSAIKNLLVLARHARFEDPGSARRDLVEAVRLARRAQDQEQLAQTLTALGQIERDLHHSEEALEYYEEAATIYRSTNALLKLAHTVRHVGDIRQEEGRLKLADESYKEALAIYRAHAETPPLELANATRGHALLKEATGETLQAIALWEEAGRLYTSVGVESGAAESRKRVGLLKQGEGAET
jgi:tetratricopeptide (TPR) repeat protein